MAAKPSREAVSGGPACSALRSSAGPPRGDKAAPTGQRRRIPAASASKSTHFETGCRQHVMSIIVYPGSLEQPKKAPSGRFCLQLLREATFNGPMVEKSCSDNPAVFVEGSALPDPSYTLIGTSFATAKTLAIAHYTGVACAIADTSSTKLSGKCLKEPRDT
ncbi:hypothetical protein MYCTH_2128866 [Thermothelomyces thermophilus ATCC 42464]|uniref:Uncharacterized protein n=1 Tax=Thermothelomyces thermophilus (strain ATCC 42464 / BCRC 31852 / DSM 1799) TaxID=573729 RepID=G2QJN0_THET4|nr:uncharacterized protein MYCTH_2128866 [Thermothelomyces thermophilus ATCC 42464]AEO59787.1 hypothetical protein MYCTH_2128866 [Thermothelomyces thermophilus ATCC 42464]